MRRVKGYVANDGGLKAQVTAREADQKSAAAQLLAAEADMARATIDLQRRSPGPERFGLGEELTQAQNAFAAAKAQLASAQGAGPGQGQPRSRHWRQAGQRHADRRRGCRDQSRGAAGAGRRDQAQVDLDRSTVRAPVDGVVAKRSVQIGQRVQAGAP
jgi:membrane fusion protein (multidrug efflux system)